MKFTQALTYGIMVGLFGAPLYGLWVFFDTPSAVVGGALYVVVVGGTVLVMGRLAGGDGVQRATDESKGARGGKK